MPTDEAADRPGAVPAGRRVARRGRLRWVVAALALLVAVFCVASARLFIWPAQGMPPRVSAIVVLGGPGDRVNKGLALARQGRAPVLIFSRGLPDDTVLARVCALHGLKFRVGCFQPVPGTTQGEAEAIGRLARQNHWTSIVLVTTPDQDTRARIRFGRCFPGSLYVVTTPLPASQWPYEIAYQWAATFRAVVLQRSC
jgi:uncharacterized SAM-binding protein YcdF (DUF218 family)